MVINNVKKAFRIRSINSMLRKSLISLIPKASNFKSFSNVRSISLCNEIFKIITRVTVSYLRPILYEFISPTHQSMFCKGINISDNIIILQEIIHRLGREKVNVGTIIHKVDLAKAYDNVSWSYLYPCLQEINSPQCLRSIINYKLCFFNVSLIKPTKGFLFIICMDKLSWTITCNVNSSLWKPFNLRRSKLAISHFFFPL